MIKHFIKIEFVERKMIIEIENKNKKLKKILEKYCKKALN